MAIHKLNIDDFEDDDYHLIAIHSLLEDYRLAYFLNLNLNLYLIKTKEDIPIQIKNSETFFSRFIFEDAKNHLFWNLFQNINVIEIKQNQDQDLFSNSDTMFSAKAYLLPEYKKVDYFLKIENDENNIEIDAIISKINKIDAINLVYCVDKDKIKSKNNLIF